MNSCSLRIYFLNYEIIMYFLLNVLSGTIKGYGGLLNFLEHVMRLNDGVCILSYFLHVPLTVVNFPEPARELNLHVIHAISGFVLILNM